jgi:heme/copper-type cytochrome/quinol oxidase subunit 2
MVFRVKVVTKAQYAAWLRQNYNPVAATAAFAALKQQTSSITPTKIAKSEGNN